MNNLNFTDWQDLWLKKDVERILRTMNSFRGFSLSVIINLVIVTFTLMLTAIPIIKQGNEMIPLIIILAVLSVVAPVVIAFAYFINNKRKDSENYRERDDDNNTKECKDSENSKGLRNTLKKFKGKMSSVNVREYVDIFDNKICNSVMMADSLFEHMKAEEDFTAKYYYICQINYYINRCIKWLYPMITKDVREKVFIDEEDCVSPNRLRLVLKLLNTLRKQTYEEMKSIKDKNESEYDCHEYDCHEYDCHEYDCHVEKFINEEIKKYDGRIISFINQFNKDNNDILSQWDKVS